MSKERNIRGYKENLASSIIKAYAECFMDEYPREAIQEWLLMGPVHDNDMPVSLYSDLMNILDEMLSPGIRVWEYYEEKLKNLFKDYIDNYTSEELYESL